MHQHVLRMLLGALLCTFQPALWVRLRLAPVRSTLSMPGALGPLTTAEADSAGSRDSVAVETASADAIAVRRKELFFTGPTVPDATQAKVKIGSV